MDSRQRGDILILAPQGNLVQKTELMEFEQVFHQAVDEGVRKVIVDLSGIRHANSTGLGALVVAHLKAGEVGGVVVLVAVPKRIMNVMEITRLSGVFRIAADEDEAVALLQ